jgi:pimeloyl-ACP methyl ester carboxylesterase
VKIAVALFTAGISALAPSAAPTPTPAAPAAPPALEGAARERIVVEGGGHAFVALPVGAREKRIVVVGVHGAGDRPDWSCTEWQAVTAGWAIVVCPVGVRHPTEANAFVWSSAEAIAAGADNAVRAVRARYGAWMLDGPMVYGGWSQGASLAAQVIASRPGSYDRAVLVEVGHTPLDATQVAAGLAAGGVKHAVVSCSSWKCRSFARDFEGAARRRNLPVRVNDVGIRGHWFDEPVYRTLGPTFVWMFEDERRFAGLGAAVDARYSTD